MSDIKNRSAGSLSKACLIALLLANPAVARQYDMPAKNLISALMDFSRLSEVEIIVPPTGLAGRRSPHLQGDYTVEQGLSLLLKGSGMSYRKDSKGVYVIYPDTSPANETSGGDVSSQVLGQLEEIIVTAEKRAQNVQDIPAAISAFSSDMLEARGISKPQDLQFSVPGLSIGEHYEGATAKVTIRGVGAENTGPGGDPGVPIHINGHYTQSTAYVLRDMLDVERVEVQRGPQGTLYGRNAVGGNINVITKRPTEEFSGSLGVDVGNYSKRRVQAIVSGPVFYGLRGRLALADENRNGYVEDIGSASGERDNSDYLSIRGALEYDPTPDVNVYLNAYYFSDKSNSVVRSIDNDPENISNSDPFKISTNTTPNLTDKSEGGSFDVSWHLGAVEFRSLSSYDKTSKNNFLDVDKTAEFRSESEYPYNYKTFTQELQLLSTSVNDIKWVIGAFYYKEESNVFFDLYLDSWAGEDFSDDPRTRIVVPDEIEATSMATFGQVDYSFTEEVEIVVGLRYTKDNKRRAGTGLAFGLEGGAYPTAAPINRKDSWGEGTGKLGINYHFINDGMLYASYSLGYKAGGFRTSQAASYDPESVDAYELGLKSRWLADRLQLNVASFYYDYQDKQDRQSIPVAGGGILQEIRNASKATVTGVELEAKALVSDALSVDVSLTYLNTEFDKFDTFDGIRPGLGVQSLSGNELPLSPEWKANVDANYVWELGGSMGTLTIRGDFTWVADQWTNAFNREPDGVLVVGNGDVLPEFHMLNANIQWESIDDIWLAEIYIRNLTDEVIQAGGAVSSESRLWASYFPPRTYGVKVGYQF